MVRMRRILSLVLVVYLLTPSATRETTAEDLRLFNDTWARTDQPVAAGVVARTWIWGNPVTTSVTEPYVDAPGDVRTVQYFDKARMERTTDGAREYVTNGLLVVEMSSGQLQRGDATFDSVAPAQHIPVAGDADDLGGPTYATIGLLRAKPAAAAGATIIERVRRDGVISSDATLAQHGVTAAELVDVPGISHRVASVFWEFLTSTGTIFNGDAYVDGALFENPFFATGFPLTEAYWATVRVGGTPQDVLLQCFERRCLTWTPGNDPAWRVEAGNVGQHYYQWRSTLDEEPPVLPELPGDALFVAQAAGRDPSWVRAALLIDAHSSRVDWVLSAWNLGPTRLQLTIPQRGTTDERRIQVWQGAALAGDGEAVRRGTLNASTLPPDLSVAELRDLLELGLIGIRVEVPGQPSTSATMVQTQQLDLGAVLSDGERATGSARLHWDASGGYLRYEAEVAGLAAAVAEVRLEQQQGSGRSTVVADLFVGSGPRTGSIPAGALVVKGIDNESPFTSLEQIAFSAYTGELRLVVELATEDELRAPVWITLPAQDYERGVNLAGAEFGFVFPGTYEVDYTYPRTSELDYFNAKGLPLIRFAFSWERLQRSLYKPFDATELARVRKVVDAAEARGMKIILDPHNFARYHGDQIGSKAVPIAAFEDFWRRLALEFKDHPGVWAYGVMTEPFDMDANWATSAQAAINAIRKVDGDTLLLVPGDQWSNAEWWPDANPGFPVSDPSDNMLYDGHIYFDKDYSGHYDLAYAKDGAYPLIGVDRLRPFVEWLRATGSHGIVTEFGIPDDDPRWNVVLDLAMAYMDINSLGGTYWAAGPWWDDYPLSVEPRNGKDRPQMEVLLRHRGYDERTQPLP